MYKNQAVQIEIQHLVCFLYLRQKRNKVVALTSTLRAGRCGHLVLVWERVSFHFQNINAAVGAYRASLTIGARITS
jgi:heme/copper-type cytochrome/quinol oxidase subunit 4